MHISNIQIKFAEKPPQMTDAVLTPNNSPRKEGRYVDPMSDFGFKKTFGEEDMKPVLISFLNSVFENDPDHETIESVTFLDKEMLGETPDDRISVLDINCKTTGGKHFIIEMQKLSQEYFIDRSLFYISKAIVFQGVKGVWDYHLNPVHCIAFMNFVDEKLEQELVVHLGLCSLKTGKQPTSTLRVTYIQLPLFNKEVSECTTLFDRIIYTFKNMKDLDSMPFQGDDNIFEMLDRKLSKANLTWSERIKYEHELRKARDHKAQMDYAVSKGIAEGEARGKAIGEAIGEAKGRLAGMLDAFKRCVASGMSQTEAASLLGLDLSQIPS